MLSQARRAHVHQLAGMGISQREIARRLGLNRRTVSRALRGDLPTRYVRAPAGSQLDALMPEIRRVLAHRPHITATELSELLHEHHGYRGSVDLVRRRLAGLRVAPRYPERHVGAVVEFAWTQLPSPLFIEDLERPVFALLASMPSRGVTAHFFVEPTIEAFLEGHVRTFQWLGGVPAVCSYRDLPAAAGRFNSRNAYRWHRRYLSLRTHYGFSSRARHTSLRVATGSIEEELRIFCRDLAHQPSIRSLRDLDTTYARLSGVNCRGASCRLDDRVPNGAGVLNPLPSRPFDPSRSRIVRVPPDRQLRYGGAFYRAPHWLVGLSVELHGVRDAVWITYAGRTAALYARSYRPAARIAKPLTPVRAGAGPPNHPRLTGSSAARVFAPATDASNLALVSA